jgi:hypothetical protein
MESRRVVIKQPRTRSALFFASLALVAVWGGFGVASTGFDRAFRLVALGACGLSGLFFLYFLVRPPTVLVISHRGIRFHTGFDPLEERRSPGRIWIASGSSFFPDSSSISPGCGCFLPPLGDSQSFPVSRGGSSRGIGTGCENVPTSASDCWNGSECVAGSATNATGKGREHDQGVRSYSSN